MPDNERSQNPPYRSRGARLPLLIAGAVTALIAVSLIGLSGLAFWGEGQKDDQGYLSTDAQPFTASTHALATENLDMDLDGIEELVDSTGLGDIRLDVAPQSGKPVFVGIARTEELSAYLHGVAHTTVTDIDYAPFEASYRDQGGLRKPAPPAGRGIWAGSANGAGPQTLTWDIQDGDWSIVVMNADGSPGVQAEISTGAKVPYLSEIGWSALGAGTLLLIGAAVLAVFGLRPPRNQAARTKATGVAASAG
jgi:hypothetical protein